MAPTLDDNTRTFLRAALGLTSAEQAFSKNDLEYLYYGLGAAGNLPNQSNTYIQSYPGYDSADGNVAMSAFMQAYYDASQNKKPLLIPQKPGITGSKWNLTGGLTTATSGALGASTPAGTTITVANTSMIPTTVPFPLILDPAAASTTTEWVTVTAVNGSTLTLAERVAPYTTTAVCTGTSGQSTIVVGNTTDLAFFKIGHKVSGTGINGATGVHVLVTAIDTSTRTVTLNTTNTGTVNNTLVVQPPGYTAGRAHSANFAVLRALPFLDNLKIKGLFPAGSEGQPVAVTVSNSSPAVECPYYWGGGSNNTVVGVEIEDIAHWSHQFFASTPRALFYQGSISQLSDCRFNRCHFKFFTQIKLVCSRVQLTNLYINNGYTVNAAGTSVTPASEGYIELSGSDNVMRNVFVDTSNYFPSDRSIVRCRWSDSVIDYLYITPAPGRPIEFTGWISGLQIPNLIINGLNTHAPFSGLAAARPAGAARILGMNYHSTDTNVVERWNGSAWVQITANTTLLASQTNVATLTTAFPPAGTGLRRWCLVTDPTLDSFARAFYSDGTRWRGPLRSSQGALQYLGADYGVLFSNVNGSVAIGNLHIRQAAQFDTDTGQAGAIRVDNTTSGTAVIIIANLQLEQSYGTDVAAITATRSNLHIGATQKDFTLNPTLTKTGSGTMTRATPVAI